MDKYCAFCESPAVAIIVETNTPLCATCQDVYECGQANADHTIEELDDEETEQ